MKFLLRKRYIVGICAVFAFLFSVYIYILLSAFGGLNGQVLSLAGFYGERRYMVLVMNNSEMRPSGGFISAYGTLSMFLGIPRFSFADSYDVPAPQETIDPPYPLNELLERDMFYKGFVFRDANFSPDFKKSAETALELYDLSVHDDDFDGVIGITISGITDMLSLLPRLSLRENEVLVRDLFHELQIDSKNIDLHSLEALSSRKNAMHDLFSQFVSHMFSDPRAVIDVLSQINALVREKQLVLYDRNPDIQKLYSLAGASGEMNVSTSDFLHVNIANIGGRKADRYLLKSISYELDVSEARQMTAKATVTVKHAGGKGLYSDFYQGFMRVYVPASAHNVQISGKFFSDVQNIVSEDIPSAREISGLIHLWPGEQYTYTFEYPVQYANVYNYSFTAIPQIGNFGELWNVVLRSDVLDRQWESSVFDVRESLAVFQEVLQGNRVLLASLQEDRTPPVIMSQRFVSENSVELSFSEAVKMVDVTISCPRSVSALSQPSSDTLVFSMDVNGLNREDSIECLLSGLQDLSGNTSLPSSRPFTLVYRP